MFKIYPIKSGSEGNAFAIESSDTKILLDCGVKKQELDTWTNITKKDWKEFKHILLTHSHFDHVGGVLDFDKFLDAKYYSSEETFELMESKRKIKLQEKSKQIINNLQKFKIENLTVNPFRITHGDYIDHYFENSFGFLIQNEFYEKLVYLTDTGKFNSKISGAKVYIVEANYSKEFLNKIIDDAEENENDADMMIERYKRLLSDSGHWSAEDCVDFLNKSINEETELIIFMHISKNQVEMIKRIVEKNLINKKVKTVFLESHTILNESYSVGYDQVNEEPF